MADTANQPTFHEEIDSEQNGASKKVTGKYGAQAATSEMNKCKKCDKRVYDMEKITAGLTIYHKTCFRCTHCNRILSVGNYTIGDNKLYCQPHYIMLFKEKGKYEFGVENKNESSGWSPEHRRPSRDAMIHSADSGSVVTRRHEQIDEVDTRSTPAKQPTNDEFIGNQGNAAAAAADDGEKRHFSAFASRRAMFESPVSPTNSQRKITTEYNDIKISDEPVKTRMAKYAALQTEKASAAARYTPTAHTQEKHTQVHMATNTTSGSGGNYVNGRRETDSGREQEPQQQQQLKSYSHHKKQDQAQEEVLPQDEYRAVQYDDDEYGEQHEQLTDGYHDNREHHEPTGGYHDDEEHHNSTDSYHGDAQHCEELHYDDDQKDRSSPLGYEAETLEECGETDYSDSHQPTYSEGEQQENFQPE